MQTVLTTPTFDRQARAAGLSDDEVVAIASAIGAAPLSGDLLQGTSGALKLRFPRPGAGKSGGFSTIHSFGSEHVPMFLLAVVDKGQRVNLSKAEVVPQFEIFEDDFFARSLIAHFNNQNF